ncbi:terminase small subunit [Roseinatronobacter sp. NSM]|uniref:terminase small subunit n=1 Tax=Roseinatronobacter sp. NSM TaxID=3457785 RepID=UPI0040367DF9
MAGLTDKQEKFVDEYLIDLNATQAAKRAGYSEKTAHRIGAENMQKPAIVARIKERQLDAQKRTEVTLDRIIEEMAKVAFSDLRKVLSPDGHLLNPQNWDDDTAGAIASLEVVAQPAGVDENGDKVIEHVHKIKTWDKMSALEKLGKHLGLGDRAAQQRTDTLAEAIKEINARGSAAPIATDMDEE